MKVYEIISEHNSIDEGAIGDAASGLWKRAKKFFTGVSEKEITKAFLETSSDAVAKSAIAVGKTPEKYIADKLASEDRRIQKVIEQEKQRGNTISREDAIDEINHIAEYGTNKIPPRPELMIDTRFRDADFQKQLIDAANKKIKKGTLSTGEKLAVGAATGAGIAGGVAAWAGSVGVIESVLAAANIYEFLKPYQEFTEKMSIAEEARNANPPQISSAQYQGVLDQETGILIASWAQLLLVPGIIKKFFGFVGNTFTLTASGRIISWIAKEFPKGFAALNGLTTVAIRDWLSQSNNAKWLAIQLGSFLGKYVPSLVQVFEKVAGTVNPWFPSDPKPADNTAASPGGTTAGNASVAATSDDSDAPTTGQYQGRWKLDPATGKTSTGRQMYTWDPNVRQNYDVTDWVTGPTAAYIKDPSPGSADYLPKPDWWSKFKPGV
jgi:hypothetical protein